MVNVGNVALLILLTQLILQVLFIGVLLVELFNHKRKNKSSVVWFLMATLFWIGFVVISEVMLFGSGFSFILSTLSIVSLVIALAIYMIIIVKWFSILNKIITFPVGIVGIMILTIAIIDRHHFDPRTILPMSLSLFFITVMGAFVLFDVLIKESSGYKVKATKKYRRIHWRLIISGLSIGVILVGLSIVGFLYSRGYVVPELSGELNVLVYVATDGFYEDFEKEYGVKINFDTVGSDKELSEKLNADPGKYDMITASYISLQGLVNDGLLMKLDDEMIPNLKYVDEGCWNEPYNDYIAPMAQVGFPLLINKKYISEEDAGWGVLWNGNYADRISVFIHPAITIGITSLYVGSGAYPDNQHELKTVRDYLLLQEPIVWKYTTYPEAAEAIISEEIWATPMPTALLPTVLKGDENLDVIFPEIGIPGANMHYAVTTSDTKKKQTVEVFINYLIGTEHSIKYTNQKWVRSCNINVEESLSEEVKRITFPRVELYQLSATKFHELIGPETVEFLEELKERKENE